MNTPAGIDDSRLRRAQAIAAGRPLGLDIVKALFTRKLEKQRAILMEIIGSRDGASKVAELTARLANATDEATIRACESRAARTYWQAWKLQRMQWVRRDQPQIPEHWSKPFNGRFARPALTPINALLHYCYAIAEVEARIACQILGLDPGLGFLHTDERNRQSLALDVLEPVRPDIDDYVLQLLQTHTFRRRDFSELNDGACRIAAPLSHELAEQSLTWAAAVAPEAELVAALLAESDGRIPARTPLSNHRLKESVSVTARRVAPGVVGNRTAKMRGAKKSKPPVSSCVECGGPLPNQERKYCDACRPIVEQAKLVRMIQAGTAAAKQRQGEGKGHPQHSPEAKKRRSEMLTRSRAENLAWDKEHPDAVRDPGVWAGILHRLPSVSVTDMARVTGLSATHCSRVRRGIQPAHPRHWPALAELIAQQPH